MNWEETFASWSKGPGQTEQDRCDNAANAIKKAIAASEKLTKLDITVFAQGSYRARTNVKADSDVDVCVRLNSHSFDEYPPSKTKENYGRVDSALTFADYKNWVGDALIAYFGAGSVTRGNKAFDIHKNSYRVDADVVPAFQHRRYYQDGSDRYLLGVGFKSDKGDLIKNWPDQTLENGVKKHDDTSRRYKRMIRILKRLRNQMQDEKIAAANDIASFLIECLVWNVPNKSFGQDTYTADVRSVLMHTFNATLKDEDCKEWGEVNELKYLFRSSQPWTREKAHAFLSAAWDYLEFK